jgi:hypothetical protein
MRTVLVLVAAAALAACSSKPDRTGQTSAGFYVPDFEMLWDVSRKEMARAGFAPDGEASSRETKTLVSRRNTQLMPFSGQGYRDQATVVLREIPDKPDHWAVEVNVLRERNTNLKAPSEIAKAEWTTGQRIPEKERQISFGIESFFLGYDVSSRFRTTYGMGPAREPIAPPPATTEK